MKKVHILISSILCLYCFNIPSLAQDITGKYVPGEMIIQLNPDIKGVQEDIIKKIEKDLISMQLQHARLLSKRMGVWLISYVNNKASDMAALAKLKAHPAIAEAQFNHYISQRETIPNDAIFFEQWALKNTGQQGGVPDADIDATDAWDINPGGVTENGDTVVVAIIDGGCFLEHPDLLLWKNQHEIPDNGVDDDNNGYIDDYDGWNAYMHSGNVTNDSHGTHVCGIAGARGNNGIGVSGVNWHAKILPVCGSSTTESVVVEAYGYVLELRATYNESNADSGAFIISSNASFGVNFGNPEDYPIWGAMYDSLGMEGIISAAATMNISRDVDVVGDVPTAFSSEFLISVTNTNRYDEKRSSAAYGDTTIDLGAPGTNIMSTRYDGSYITKTGTSMASPHVAGAVAYLLSAADHNFLNNYKNDPETYCLKLKQYILDGVDTLPGFDTLTVSGGRLNLYKSLMILQDPPEMDLDPEFLSASLYNDQKDSANLEITNSGGHTLKYSINENALPEWLSLSKASGNLQSDESEIIKVFFEPHNLSAATYNYDLPILYNHYNHDTVAVELQVLSYPGINESINQDLGLEIYPNPFRENIVLRLNLKQAENLKISLFNANGKKIETIANKRFQTGDHKLVLNLEIKKGIYYLVIKKQSHSLVKKIIRL